MRKLVNVDPANLKVDLSWSGDMSYLYENHQPGHQKYSGMLHNGLWHTLSGQGTGYNISGANRLIGEVV